MIEFTKVKASYDNGCIALDGVSFKVEPGEFVYVIGETGSGKSSIVKVINGELKPTAGKVVVGKTTVNKLTHHQMPFHRRRMGVIFQDFRLLEYKRVYENLEFAAECVGKGRREARVRIKSLLNLVGLWDKRNAFPLELSGGQQQSVAIARALMNNPKVIIADEPTGNLDPQSSEKIMDILFKLNREEGVTIVMVTHNINLIKRYPQRVLVIKSGCIYNDIPKDRLGAFVTRSS